MTSQLPPLPPLPPLHPKSGRSGSDEPRPERIDYASALPIPSEDPSDPVRVKFKCAGCGELHAWYRNVWGSWDTEHQVPVMVRKPTGRWVRFYVPLRRRGRVGPTCGSKLTEFRVSKEPEVTEGPAEIKADRTARRDGPERSTVSTEKALLGDIIGRTIPRMQERVSEGNGRWCKWPDTLPDEVARAFHTAGHIANRLLKEKKR